MSEYGGTFTAGQNLSVVPANVREVGAFVYELSEALRNVVDSAAEEVASLTDGTWTGDAATKF
ncbi:type VII secretion target [Nocardia sp. NPDC006044]|uniref:type VII secretion target n=1 Tax=Nocardia sp. NPDC006044 TaxID=3364306 RepID=UPI0036CFE7A5